MKSFTDFAFNEEYKRVQRLGDWLAEIESLIDWSAFRPIVGELMITGVNEAADRMLTR